MPGEIVSLFSGCGGLDLGFTQAGFKVAWANEYDSSIWDTYEKNHSDTLLDKRDVREILSSEIPDCIGVIGGPPCQSWSEAGVQKGINDERGQLFLEYVRILRDKQPLFFLAENVSGMLQKKHTDALNRILESFEKAGYHVSYKLLNTVNYGVPQDRERVIFIGYHHSLECQFNFDRLETQDCNHNLYDAIWDLRESAIPAKDKNKTNGELCYVPNHEYMLGGFSSHYMSRNRVRSWDEPSFTIQAGGRHAPIHPQANRMIHVGRDQFIFDPNSVYPYRRLSVRECARIQTFPDEILFYYRDLANGYKMIGNAVPVKFSQTLAQAVKYDLFEKKYNKIYPNNLSYTTIQLCLSFPNKQNDMTQSSSSYAGKTNILRAIKTVVDNPVFDVVNYYRSNNKINSAGDSLELFVKDIFAGTLHEQDEENKMTVYEQLYSYFGNANNPPDFMISQGDAVEVKKLTSESAQVALNSSYPSAKLFSDSLMITEACRSCEQWREKDLIYAIGCVGHEKLSLLWLVYGDCYAASREVYEKIKQKIAKGVSEIQGVEFSQTKELGRVNKVDPLGITNLRIRGMWHIDHPQKVYRYLNIETKLGTSLRIFALMREEKYNSFPSRDREWLESSINSDLQILSLKIKDPDNPVKRISAKLISFQI